MCTVGYIDDDNGKLPDYTKRLLRYDIKLKTAPVGSLEQIKQWIVTERIECVIIEYQLGRKYDFFGTELFSYLNDELPGLPCMILTSHTDLAIKENIVVRNCIFDRSIMDETGQEFGQFCEIIKQSAEVFENNIARYKLRYKKLYQKKVDGSITPREEEELLTVFRILRTYEEVGDISSELLTTKVSTILDDVLVKLDGLLKK